MQVEMARARMAPASCRCATRPVLPHAAGPPEHFPRQACGTWRAHPINFGRQFRGFIHRRHKSGSALAIAIAVG